MNRKEKTPACPDDRQEVDGTIRQHDPSLCPNWCTGEHLHEAVDEPGKVWHDSADAAHWIETRVDGVEQLIAATLTRLDDGRGAGTPLIRLQDMATTVARLTPAEARALARSLDELANLADPDNPARVVTAAEILAQLDEHGARMAELEAVISRG